MLEAGHKRARPIVMTSVAMMAGMLPVALGLGRSAAFQAQMAIAVIGGLITSTGLTLVMVPATFTWIDDLERWVGRKIGHGWINKKRLARDFRVRFRMRPPRSHARPSRRVGCLGRWARRARS